MNFVRDDGTVMLYDVSYAFSDSSSNPDTENVCSLYTGELYPLPGFCSLAGLGGASNRTTWCGKLSEQEWGVNNRSGDGDCTYDSCAPYKEHPGGCTSGCCGIVGKGVDCTRQKFTGDEVECCMLDLECNGGLPATGDTSPDACFSDAEHKKTCHPCNRSLTSSPQTAIPTLKGNTTCQQAKVSSCQEIMYDYCTGSDLDPADTSWIQRWIDGTGQPQICVTALERNLFQDLPATTRCNVSGIFNLNGTCRPVTRSTTVEGTSTGPESGGGNVNALSTQGTEWASGLISGVFDKYSSQGFVLGSIPGQPGYSNFQDLMYSVCCNVPIICQAGLQKSCSIYTSQRLSLNPAAANWCGCYLPQSQYTEYTDDYGVPLQCTPMCNRPTTIPPVAGDNTQIFCEQTVCIIDDVTINLNNVSLDGGINISQICGNCGGGLQGGSSCSCVLSNTTIDGADAQLGSINVSQSCTGTTCVVKKPPGRYSAALPNTLPVPCDQPSDPIAVYDQAQRTYDEQNAINFGRRILLVVLIIGILLLIIFLIWFFTHPVVNQKRKVGYVPQAKTQKAAVQEETAPQIENEQQEMPADMAAQEAGPVYENQAETGENQELGGYQGLGPGSLSYVSGANVFGTGGEGLGSAELGAGDLFL